MSDAFVVLLKLLLLTVSIKHVLIRIAQAHVTVRNLPKGCFPIIQPFLAFKLTP